MTTPVDKYIELPTPADAQLSPDGQWIAYCVQTVDWKENAFVEQIHLIAADGQSESRQLTYHDGGSTAPRWSPDGKHIIFLSKRGDDQHKQIYRMARDGGEAKRLTQTEKGVGAAAYAPDGKKIAFSAVPPDTPAQKERQERYGDYIEDNVDYQRAQLWLLTVADQKVTQLTAGDRLHVRDFRWHPDSKRIALHTMPAPDMGTLLETRIHLLDTETFALEPLTPQRTFSPRWSPDGSALVYQQAERDSVAGAFYKNGKLAIHDMQSGQERIIPLDFDEDCNPLHWGEDGIYFYAIWRTSVRLFRVSPAGATVEEVTPGEIEGFVAINYSFGDDPSHCALIYGSPERYYEIAVLDLTTGELTTLTDFDAPTRDWDLPTHELYTWQSADGTAIEGILTRPRDFDPDLKYPLLVATHGGPTWVSLRVKLGAYERRFYPFYEWLEQGAIILQPNYRGGAGYGEAFRSLNVRDLGTGDFADVISGVDALLAEGYIDETRLGKMGWSQGGYISAFTTTYSRRFAAVSVGAGISNWLTYYVNTDIHPFTISYLKATPWDDPEIYAQTSPMTYIKNAATPTLIQHGEKDERVPLPNAYELHQGLLDQGVASKLVVYPGMGHGPTKPRQVRHIMMDNLRWFNRHIFGIDPDPDAAAPLYIALAPTAADDPLLADVRDFARRDDAVYRVLAAGGTLGTDPDDAVTTLTAEVGALVENLQAALDELGSKKVVLFTEAVEKNRASLLVLGCFQIAASRFDDITVEHRAGDDTLEA